MSDNTLTHSISFSVKPGQKAIAVGSAGVGETTLINLLTRFYKLSGRKITLDETDTKDMLRSDLRSDFGMVLQNTWLFDGMVTEDIAYSKPDVTHEEIIVVAKVARVDFSVHTMSHGHDMVLDDNARDISVDQRQFLTIVRAFLCDPAVTTLDEVASGADTRTEIEIGRVMKAPIKNRTSFIITHKLSTTIDADLILFMQNGNITEQGMRGALLKTGGVYADMYYDQLA